MKRLIIGISGASGAIYGVRMLQVLRDVPDIETHLILSQAARQTLAMETDYSVREVQALADVVHDARDIAASISSGSFKTAGMVILPCSMKTLSGIVHSYTDGLLTRAADVVLKERRPLVLCVRETPFHLGHLRLLVQAAELGCYGITSNALAPAARTRMSEQAFGDTMATQGQAFDSMNPDNIAPTVVWLGSSASAHVSGCVFELEGGKIMIEDGWREGPFVDKGACWAPADVGAAVDELLSRRVPPRKVWGTA